MPRKSRRGGAMKKYPRILDYLQNHHKKVYELIDDAGMHASLTPRRGGSITFLIPDEKLIAKIRKTLDSDDPEKATDMILSLILKDLLVTPQDFAEKQDDIPTALGKKLVVKNVSKDKVTIDNGTLVPDTKFKPFDRQGPIMRGNLAVWKLNGEVDYENAPKSDYKYLRGNKSRSKKGGYSGGALPKLYKDVSEILTAERKALEEDRKDANGKTISPMYNAVNDLIRSLKPAEREKVIYLLCGNPRVDFFVLFENPHILDPFTVVHREAGSGNAYQEALSEVAQKMKEKGDYQKEIQNAKEKVLAGGKWGKKRIKQFYEKFDWSKVYPDSLAKIVNSRPGLLQGIQEVQHFMKNAWERVNLEVYPGAKSRAFKEMFCTFRDCYGRPMFKNIENKLVFSGVSSLHDTTDSDLIEHFVLTQMGHITGGGIIGGEDEDEFEREQMSTEIELTEDECRKFDALMKLSDEERKKLMDSCR